MYLCTAFYTSRSNLRVVKAVKVRAEQNFHMYTVILHFRKLSLFTKGT
jgi:hypothetical protein